MATNAAPIYGKQYIRYAETWEAAVDAAPTSPNAAAAGTAIGIVEIGELRAVTYLSIAGPNVAATPGDLAAADWLGNIVGINQAYMPTALSQPYTARQLTVATSGLLLVEVDPSSAAIGINSPLNVNLLGQATLAGSLVSLDGTTPYVRENVTIGGRRLVLVSFA
jgi:hypothetical protein